MINNSAGGIVNNDDYIDEDVAYLIGLLTAKGKLIEVEDNRRLIIDFPFINLTTRAPRKSGIDYIVPDKIKIGLFDIQSRLHELLGEEVFLEESANSIHFVVKFDRNTMVWRNIKTIFQGKENYHEFEINPVFYQLPMSIQSSFVRGFADAASMPSVKDADQIKRHRVVLQFSHSNWNLPVQMCRLLQENLNIKVLHILYGHPSMGRGFREHRMRIYPEEFIKIGYGFNFKQDILRALLEDNLAKFQNNIKQCNPKTKKVTQKKDKNIDEKNDRLPTHLRKHFNTYWQICKVCGCKQGKKISQDELILDGNDEN